MNLAIYGAQSIALGICEALKSVYPQREIISILVTKKERNPQELCGIPVLEMQEFANQISDEEKNNIEIMIATPENVMEEIEYELDVHGFNFHTRMTSVRWAKIMGYYYFKERICTPLEMLPVGNHLPKLKVFMAKFYKDKELTSKYKMPEWIIPIQVGAALCEKRVAEVLDCTGDNISQKNVNYSELTALYWIWRNCLKSGIEDINTFYGLFHYRRILDISDDDILKLLDNGVDVVLPYPMPYEPNIESHHQRYIMEGDWKALVKAIEEIQPKYAKKMPEIMGQRYLYNYNIMLAKRDVLNKYCEWLFPILERTEELSVPKGCDRKDRYIGYMAETLTTLYFMFNKDNLNIVHAGCKFLT